MNFSICLKMLEKNKLKKIPMTKDSNLSWASNPWPTRSQLLFSYFTVTIEIFLSFSKTDLTRKKNAIKKGGSVNSVFHGMNLSICLKIPEKNKLKKIPMTKDSNLPWASNPWPTRSQLLFSYFTVTSEIFLSFSKNDLTRKKKL